LGLYYDPSGKSAEAFNVNGMPTTILLDTNGKEIGRFVGATEWHSFDSIKFMNHFIYRK
jgi:thioredoxin-related protein